MSAPASLTFRRVLYGRRTTAVKFDRCCSNRSDHFSRLVSMSSPSASMQAYRDRGAAEGDAGMQAKADETYSAGDINTSLIQTARGRTVMLQHDVVSPRPCAQPTHLT